jgi:small subunit ribosomal protein S3
MGQKANPILLRLGIVKDWESTWFDIRQYPKLILEDKDIREYMRNELRRAGVSDIHIRRKADQVEIDITAARPGIVMGKGGADITYLRDELNKKTGKKVTIKVKEEKHAERNSRLIGEVIAGQLEKRIPFRRAMKMAVQRAMKAGAQGVKIMCAGRLGGVEIARQEWYREGKVPLHTLRADIDYAFTEALTTYGKIGIKVWIYNGEIFTKNEQEGKAAARVSAA